MFRSLSLLTAAVLFMTGSAQAAEITHEMGVTEVPDAPQRVVVLEYSFVDALASVGVAPVGIADDNDRDKVIPAYREIIGNDWTGLGTRATPSLEVIASLQPDLIIADKTRHAEAYDTLSEIAPTIVLDSLTGDYQDAMAQTATIGEALGKSEEMTARREAHEAQMAKYAEQIGRLSNGITAQFGVTNATGLWLHSPNSYIGSLLDRLGFAPTMQANDDGSYEATYVPTTLEQLSEVNPQLLILGEYADPSAVDDWEGEPLFEALQAVKTDNVHYVTAHNWSRLRGMMAAEMVAEDLSKILQD